MIVAVPRRAEAVGPDALQIGGKIAGAAARDEQVSAELKILRDELLVFAAALQAFEPLVGGRLARTAEFQLDAVEERLVVGDVRLAQLGVTLRRRPFDLALAGRLRVGAAI